MHVAGRGRDDGSPASKWVAALRSPHDFGWAKTYDAHYLALRGTFRCRLRPRRRRLAARGQIGGARSPFARAERALQVHTCGPWPSYLTTSSLRYDGEVIRVHGTTRQRRGVGL
jgi:hypothetical protein